MKIPKFLIADNSKFEEDIFVIHTEFPRFILNVSNDHIEWIDKLEQENPEEISDEIEKLMHQAEEFYEQEMDFYENQQDE